METARELGDELVVGLMSDWSVAQYKPPPIMNQTERSAVLRACRLVDEVIEDGPLCPAEDFLRRHRIDLVVHGDDNRFEKEYAAPIRMGIMRYVPYTPTISSSDIRDRILKQQEKPLSSGGGPLDV